MPGWNGAGVFVLPYSMVAEAAAGVKILASHQDTQWNAVKEGLELCLTRDGQNSPSADISWALHKITDLDIPTGDQDAANKAYVDARVNNPWVEEGNAVFRITANAIRVVGGDYTATYTLGRRLRITHNGGATVSYATVFASVYPGSGGFPTDTVLGLSVDDSITLLAPITLLEYGQLDPQNPPYLDPFTVVLAYTSITAPYGVAPALTKIGFDAKAWDTNGEYDLPTMVFSCRYPGYYMVSACLNIGATPAGNGSIHIYLNGVTEISFPFVLAASSSQAKQFSIPMYLARSDYLEVYLECGVNCSIVGDPAKPYSNFSITRLQ